MRTAMTQIVIQPSSKALHHFMILTAIVTVAVCGFATLFFWRFGHFRPHFATTFVTLTWVVVPLVWLVASIVTSRRWQKTSYVFGDDYLSINKASIFGGTNQRMYRYETMISLRTNQSFSGKRHGYGTIRIMMPRPEHEVVIHYVPEPERQAVFIKNQIAGRRPRTHAETL